MHNGTGVALFRGGTFREVFIWLDDESVKHCNIGCPYFYSPILLVGGAEIVSRKLYIIRDIFVTADQYAVYKWLGC